MISFRASTSLTPCKIFLSSKVFFPQDYFPLQRFSHKSISPSNIVSSTNFINFKRKPFLSSDYYSLQQISLSIVIFYRVVFPSKNFPLKNICLKNTFLLQLFVLQIISPLKIIFSWKVFSLQNISLIE